MIIITAPVHPVMTETFEKKGLSYQHHPSISYAELFDMIAEAKGIVVSTHIPIDRKMIDKAPKLEWIARVGSGMEHIDVAYASGKNIRCISSPEGNSTAVAEHALGLLLNLLRNINKSSKEVALGIWQREQNRGMELSGKTVGIIGYGNTGSAFAGLLASFDVSVLAYDKYRTGFDGQHVKEATLEEIISQADVISFHLPLTAETKHFANTAFFSGIKKKPVLLNTSRGKVIDTTALQTALEKGFISAAGLDVLENEDLTSYNQDQKDQLERLCAMKNVIITPHIAGYSHEAPFKMSRILLQKLGMI